MTSDSGPDYDYLFKILLIGDTSVGKTSLLTRFIENRYSDDSLTTIGIDFVSHNIAKILLLSLQKIKCIVKNEKKIKLQIWDTCGQERFRNMIESYYRGGNGILVVYDITNRKSFECLTSWLIDIENKGNKNMYKILIGNKCDLEDKREVKREEGEDFANKNGMDFFETSAKTTYYVQEAFDKLTSEILEIHERTERRNSRKQSFRIKGESKAIDINETKKNHCCK